MVLTHRGLSLVPLTEDTKFLFITSGSLFSPGCEVRNNKTEILEFVIITILLLLRHPLFVTRVLEYTLGGRVEVDWDHVVTLLRVNCTFRVPDELKSVIVHHSDPHLFRVRTCNLVRQPTDSGTSSFYWTFRDPLDPG